MASQHQFPQNNTGPPGTGSMGRGGYGGRKRGGYKGNGRGNYNNSNWRPAPYESQNYGAQNSGSQGPPAPWGTHYGNNSSYAAPNGSADAFIVPQSARSTYDVPTMSGSYLQHMDAITGRAPVAVPPVPTTPIATTIVPAPKSRQVSQELKGPSRTKLLSDAGDAARERPKATGPQLFTPLSPAEIRQRGLHTIEHSKQHPWLQEYVPGEDLIAPIDVLHRRTQDRFEAFHGVSLQIPGVKKGVAEKLEAALSKARETHQAHEAASQYQRSKLLDVLLEARESEQQHDGRVRNYYHRFTNKMSEIQKLEGEEKVAAQREATRFLKAAAVTTDMATEARRILDNCRQDLLHLDNVRVISANTYADTVQEAVKGVLKCVVERQTGPSKTAGSEELPPTTQPITAPQIVIERQPKKEDNITVEVSYSSKQNGESGALNGKADGVDAEKAESSLTSEATLAASEAPKFPLAEEQHHVDITTSTPRSPKPEERKGPAKEIEGIAKEAEGAFKDNTDSDKAVDGGAGVTAGKSKKKKKKKPKKFKKPKEKEESAGETTPGGSGSATPNSNGMGNGNGGGFSYAAVAVAASEERKGG